MKKELQQKLIQNGLLALKFSSLSMEERRESINKWVESGRTMKELSELTGHNYSTLTGWRALRNSTSASSPSLKLIYDKLVLLRPDEITDWGRMHMIKEEVDRLFRDREKYK